MDLVELLADVHVIAKEDISHNVPMHMISITFHKDINYTVKVKIISIELSFTITEGLMDDSDRAHEWLVGQIKKELSPIFLKIQHTPPYAGY